MPEATSCTFASVRGVSTASVAQISPPVPTVQTSSKDGAVSPGTTPGQEAGIATKMAIGFTAGGLAQLIAVPFDVIKIRMQSGASYDGVYDFLTCNQVNPCNGWLTANATFRNETTAWAESLNDVLREVAYHPVMAWYLTFHNCGEQ